MASDIMGWLIGGVVVIGLGWVVLQLTKGGSLMLPGLGNMSPEVMSPGDLTPAQDSALDNNDMFGPSTPMTCDDGYDDAGKSCRCSTQTVWAFMGSTYTNTGAKTTGPCDCGMCDMTTGKGYVPPGVNADCLDWNGKPLPGCTSSSGAAYKSYAARRALLCNPKHRNCHYRGWGR